MPGLIVTLGGSSTPYEQMLARSVTQAKAAGVAIQREYAKAQTMIGSASFQNFNSATSLGTAATSTVLNSREAKTAAQEYGEFWKDALSKQEAGIRAVRMEQLALLAASAKGNFGQGIHGTGAGGGISGIMRETLVIFREIGRGNMTRVPGSLLLLLQYTGMLNLMMKGEKTEALLAAAAQEKLAKSTARAALAAEAKVRAAKIAAGMDVRSPELQTAEAEAADATAAAQARRAEATTVAANSDALSKEAAIANVTALEAERDAAIKDGVAQTLRARETAAAAATIQASAATTISAIGLMLLPIALLVAGIVAWYIAIDHLISILHAKREALEYAMEAQDRYSMSLAEQISAEERLAEAIDKTTDALRKMNEAKNQSVEITQDAIEAANAEADARAKLYEAATKGKLLDIEIAEKTGRITHAEAVKQKAAVESQAVADKAAAQQKKLDNEASIANAAAKKAAADKTAAQAAFQAQSDANNKSPEALDRKKKLEEAEKIKKTAAEDAADARKEIAKAVGSGAKKKDIDALKNEERAAEDAEKNAEKLIVKLKAAMKPGEIAQENAQRVAEEATSAATALAEKAKKATTAATTNAANSPAEVAAEQANIAKHAALDAANEPEKKAGGFRSANNVTERERIGLGAASSVQVSILDFTKKIEEHTRDSKAVLNFIHTHMKENEGSF